MKWVSLCVLLILAAVDIWAWRRAPGARAADQFIAIWRTSPWGRQFYVDFFGLQVLLALLILADAAQHGSWLTAVLCVGTMPIFGAAAAAAYWVINL